MECINAFLTTVGSDLAKQFASQAGPPLIQTSNFAPFKLKLVTTSEVMTLLSGLSMELWRDPLKLQQINSFPLFPLATIFNFSLLTGTILNKWKQAVVTPVFNSLLGRQPFYLLWADNVKMAAICELRCMLLALKF